MIQNMQQHVTSNLLAQARLENSSGATRPQSSTIASLGFYSQKLEYSDAQQAQLHPSPPAFVKPASPLEHSNHVNDRLDFGLGSALLPLPNTTQYIQQR